MANQIICVLAQTDGVRINTILLPLSNFSIAQY